MKKYLFPVLIFFSLPAFASRNALPPVIGMRTNLLSSGKGGLHVDLPRIKTLIDNMNKTKNGADMIKCKTYFKGETYKKAIQLHAQFSKAVKVYQILGITIILLTIINFVIMKFNGWDNGYILIFGLTGLLFLFFPKILVYSGMRRLKIAPFYGKEINWEISESLSVTSEGFNANTKLELFYKVIFTKDGILIYPQKNLFHWLPKESFQDEESYIRAIELISLKMDKSKQINAYKSKAA